MQIMNIIDEIISEQAVIDSIEFFQINPQHFSFVNLIADIKELPPAKPKWIPVSNPREELPKDRILWVTIGDGSSLGVMKLYWDMTEWSEDIVDYVLAYMDYIEPTPYKTESEDK